MPPILRSILAVIAGFIVMSFVVGVLTVLAVKSMHLQSGHPTPAYLALNVVYSLLAAAVGGFITGLIAPSRPLLHGEILAAIMLLMGALSYLHYTGSQPTWYKIFLVLAPPLVATAGAAFCQRSARRMPS